MAVACINCFVTPYGISFYPNHFENAIILMLIIIIDILFRIDIFVSFQTSFIQPETGIEVFH
ncbi:unnamed protein product [Moneuplotes crassus]|uniref:Uncharacterized protein n=1 Tax=Euplotes crassus TaxID=5936 RepID=A0AAD1UE44_EUPCR|nr:unnamed protein product [Moneuplotes crassus]